MHVAKRLISLTLAAALSCAVLAGCSGEADSSYTMSVCVGDIPSTLDPIYAQDAGDQTILTHLYENLMRRSVAADGTVTVVNGMAKDVKTEKSLDGSATYTFKLRKAKWSDGRDVTANDFVYAWQRLADPASQSPYASLLSIVAGYTEARSSGDLSLLQITAKNDSTLVVTLDGDYDWFLTDVCTATATLPLRADVIQTLKTTAAAEAASSGSETVRRWWSDPTALVTNGPYCAVSYDSTQLQTQAHSDYYRTITGPSALSFCFASSVEDAQALYDSGGVDAVWPLSQSQLEALSTDENWTPIPELCTYSVLFNGSCDTLEDPLVRQAMHLVIDRNRLAALADVTAVAAEGIIPPGVPGDENGTFREVYGSILTNDPELYPGLCAQANDLLEQAGYDSGANLEALQYIYVDDGHSAAVAQALCGIWQDTLQLKVIPQGVAETDFWSMIRSGAYDLAGIHLDAPGNDAECFLRTWTSSNPDNLIGYENSAYDTLLRIISTAEDEKARMGCLHDAEVLLLEDYVIAPLYTLGTDWLLRTPYSGAYRDARGWFCFTDVTLPST